MTHIIHVFDQQKKRQAWCYITNEGAVVRFPMSRDDAKLPERDRLFCHVADILYGDYTVDKEMPLGKFLMEEAP